jgi:hypothetical protein
MQRLLCSGKPTLLLHFGRSHFDPKRPFGLMNSQPYLIFGAASVRGGGLPERVRGNNLQADRTIAP